MITKSRPSVSTAMLRFTLVFEAFTNARTEAFNSRIQWLKSTARGFRSFHNYRTRFLFFCGRLDMLPEGCH